MFRYKFAKHFQKVGQTYVSSTGLCHSCSPFESIIRMQFMTNFDYND
jgi:hypothetical protein